MVVGLWVPWLTEFLCFLRSFSPAFPSFPGGPRVIKPTHPPPLALHYPLAPFTSRLTANTYTHAHTHTQSCPQRWNYTYCEECFIKTNKLQVVNEWVFPVPVLQQKGSWMERKMVGGQKRKREEAIKKFLHFWTNGLFRCGSLPRLSGNGADTYYITKLFSFDLLSFISFLIFLAVLFQTYMCKGNYNKGNYWFFCSSPSFTSIYPSLSHFPSLTRSLKGLSIVTCRQS